MYGEALIKRLATDLSARLGGGFSTTNLKQMRSYHLAPPADRIGQTPSDLLPGNANLPLAIDLFALAKAFLLPWSAYVALLSVSSADARAFYETEALRGGWSVRQLKRQLQSQFCERTMLSRDKAAKLDKANADPDRGSPESFSQGATVWLQEQSQ